jgi:hypothetical protein
VRLCRPRDPEAKGANERTNGYLETSFLPGRSFEDANDFNGQLQRWLVRANGRVHGTTRKVPATELFEDRGAMRPLPRVLPDPAARFSVRLPRDHYVRFDTNDYSVDPRAIGRRVDVRVDLQELTATCGGTEVARHRSFYGKHRSLLQPVHARELRRLREVKHVATDAEQVVEVRDLADYDRVLGVV